MIPTLAQLFKARRKETYKDLAQRVDVNSPQALQKLTKPGLAEFPRPKTIRALAKALHVSELDVILSISRTLDLIPEHAVEGPVFARSLPAEVDQLDASAQGELVKFARALCMAHGLIPPATA